MKSEKAPQYSYLIFLFFCLISSVALFFLITLIANAGLNKIGDFDFKAFYTGGYMVSNHVTDGFYLPKIQYEWQQQIFYVPTLTYLVPFIYPTFVTLPFVLLSALSVPVAYEVTAVINMLLAIITFYVILHQLKIFSSRFITLISCIALFTFMPLWDGLMQGQVSFMIFLSLIITWILLKKRNKILAGLVLSLLLVRPTVVIIPFFIFFWKREWEVVAGIGVGSFLLLLLSSLITGPTFLSQYSTALLSYSSIAGIYAHPQSEPIIRGLLHAMYHTNDFTKIFPAYLLLSGITLGIMLYGWRGKMTTGIKFDLQWAMLILTMTLTSLHTNPHDLLLLIFPAIVFSTISLRYLLSHRKPLWQTTLFISLFLFVVFVGGILFYTPLTILTPIPTFLFLVGTLSLLKRTHQLKNEILKR